MKKDGGKRDEQEKLLDSRNIKMPVPDLCRRTCCYMGTQSDQHFIIITMHVGQAGAIQINAKSKHQTMIPSSVR